MRWLEPISASFRWDREAYMRLWAQLRRFGLTEADRAELIAEQDQKCTVCRKPLEMRNRRGNIERLVIDHDHETGVVRGILHDGCNKILAMADDNTDALRGAADYVDFYRNEENWRGPHRKIPDF